MIKKRFTWKSEKLQHLNDEVLLVVDNMNKDWKGHILNVVDLLNQLHQENEQLRQFINKGRRLSVKELMDNVNENESLKKKIKKLEKENEQLQKQINEYNFTDQFKFNFLEEYVLLNRYEIKKFILLNDDLIELFQEINILRNKYFNSYPCSLEFVQDPEFTSLDQLVIYIHGAESSFDEDWETLKLLNKDIRMLNISNNSIKNLVSVDMWCEIFDELKYEDCEKYEKRPDE